MASPNGFPPAGTIPLQFHFTYTYFVPQEVLAHVFGQTPLAPNNTNTVANTPNNNPANGGTAHTSGPTGAPNTHGMPFFMPPVFGIPQPPFGFPFFAAPGFVPPGGMNAMGPNGFENLLNQLYTQWASQQRGPPPASASVLDKLPTCILTKAHLAEQPNCSVCQEDFREGAAALQLPCGHLFDRDCVMPWLKEHNTCPVCRYELPVDDPQLEKARQERMASRRTVFDVNPSAPSANVPDDGCEFQRIRGQPCVLVPEEDEEEAEPSSNTNHGDTASPMEIDSEVKKSRRQARKVSLPCGHKFHRQCIESWRRIDNQLPSDTFRCPRCRRNTSCYIEDVDC